MTTTFGYSRRRALALSTAAIAGAMVLSGSASMAQSWPERPLEILIPFSAGGANDLVARAVAQRLEGIIGQPVVPINRTGAGGYVMAQSIVSGAPDGHTLGHVSLGTFILTSMFNEQAIDPLSDVRYVAQMATLASAVAVPASSPHETLEDLLEHMRANPGDYSWGHTGQGGFHHINGVSLMMAADVDAVDIPFQGSSNTVAALMGGHIEFAMMSTSNYLGFQEELRFLAFASETKDEVLPDVPTVYELGLDLATVETPSVMMVHRDTPDEIVAQLEAAVREVVASEDYREAMLQLGITPAFATGAEVEARIDSSIEGWRAVIDAIEEAAN
jgi:tripartite-type tricarboxylate transporter receptor subunit TctC